MEPIGPKIQPEAIREYQSKISNSIERIEKQVSKISEELQEKGIIASETTKVERKRLKPGFPLEPQVAINKIIENISLITQEEPPSTREKVQQLETILHSFTQAPLPQDLPSLERLDHALDDTTKIFEEVCQKKGLPPILEEKPEKGRPAKKRKIEPESPEEAKEPSPKKRRLLTTGQAVVQPSRALLPGETHKILKERIEFPAEGAVTEGQRKIKTLLNTPSINISERLLYHLLGDAIGTTSKEFVGYDQNLAMTEVCAMFDGISCFGDSAFQTCLQNEKKLLQKGNDFAQRLSHASPQQMNALSAELVSTLSSLDPKERFVMPGGWLTSSGGHAIILEMKRSLLDPTKFTLFINNTGDGIEYHEVRTVREKRFASRFIIDSISLEDLSSPLFLTSLAAIQDPQAGDWTAKDFYETILPCLHGVVQKDESPFGELQRSGTCAFASLFLYLEHSMPPGFGKRAHLALGLKALSKFVQAQNTCRDRASCLFVGKCMHYFSQMLLDARADQLITADEFTAIQDAVHQIGKTVSQREQERIETEATLRPAAQLTISEIAAQKFYSALKFMGCEGLYNGICSTLYALKEGPKEILEKYRLSPPLADPEITVFRDVDYKDPFKKTEEKNVSSAQLPQIDLSSPEAIGTALSQVISWAEEHKECDSFQEAHCEIEIFSRALIEACKNLQPLLKSQGKAELGNLMEKISSLADLYIESFTKSTQGYKRGFVVSPIVFSCLTNFICSAKILGSHIEAIQRYPLLIGKYAPGGVATEEYYIEHSLEKNFKEFGIAHTPSSKITATELEPKIPISMDSTHPLTSFLDFIYSHYGEKIDPLIPAEEYVNNGRVLAAMMFSEHSELGKTILPAELFHYIHLDNLVYFLQKENIQEHGSFRDSPTVEWSIDLKAGGQIVKPETDRFPTSYCPIRKPETAFGDSEDVALRPEKGDIDIQKLKNNSGRIDLAIAHFSSHPEYFKDEKLQKLFENIIFQPDALQKNVHDPVWKNAPLYLVEFLDHQMNLAMLGYDKNAAIFLLRQYRMLYERSEEIFSSEDRTFLRKTITKKFEQVFCSISRNDRDRFTLLNTERARFLHVDKQLSPHEVDQLIESVITARRNLPIIEPLLEYDTISFTHHVFSREDVQVHLSNLPNELINASLGFSGTSRTWKQIDTLYFTSEEPKPALDFYLSTGSLLDRSSKNSLIETPSWIWRTAAFREATHDNIPEFVTYEGGSSYSFVIEGTSFRIVDNNIFKHVDGDWLQYVTCEPQEGWFSHPDPETELMRGEIVKNFTWVYKKGKALRIENEKGIPILEGERTEKVTFLTLVSASA